MTHNKMSHLQNAVSAMFVLSRISLNVREQAQHPPIYPILPSKKRKTKCALCRCSKIVRKTLSQKSIESYCACVSEISDCSVAPSDSTADWDISCAIL